MNTAIAELNKSFVGATSEELRSASIPGRLCGVISQNTRFAHSGVISVTDSAIVFGDWMTLPLADVVSVSRKFTDAYGRLAAAGVRGGFGSFGIFEKWGAPIVIEPRHAEALYVLVDFRHLFGTTSNAAWTTSLRSAFPDLTVTN